MHTAVLPFIAMTTVLVITPGLGTAFLIGTVLDRGRRLGLWAVGGMATGLASHALLGALGLSIAVARVPWALPVLAALGGIVLMGIGGASLVRLARSRSAAGQAPSAPSTATAAAPLKVASAGYIVQLFNPSLMVFYLAIVPQYVPRDYPYFRGATTLGAIHIGIAVVWLSVLVFTIGGLAKRLQTPAFALTLRAITAVMLIAFGVSSVARAF